MGSCNCAWNWVPSTGASGGLISIWNEDVLLVEDVFLAKRVQAIKLRGVSDGFVWAIANVYGPNVLSDRSEFLEELSNIISLWPVPWVFGGDFNMIRYPYEKKGGSSISHSMDYSPNSSMIMS